MPHSNHHLDPQLGLDIHSYVIAPAVIPVILPTPRIAFVLDIFDYLPIIGSTTKINGLIRGAAGTGGIGYHIPVAASLMPLPRVCNGPQIGDEIFLGSKTVIADGEPMSRFSEPVLDCCIYGMVPPIREKSAEKEKPKSLELPLGINLAVPNGVKVGGPSTINRYAIAMKAGLPLLKKIIRSEFVKGLRKKIFPNMNCENSWLCRTIFGDPVDICDGSVVVEHQDFLLAGRLPLDWTRYYTSKPSVVPLVERVCGMDWQTPADVQLSYDPEHEALFFYEALTFTVFPAFPAAPGREHAVTELVEGGIVWLLQEAGCNRLIVETKAGRRYHFRYPSEQPVPERALPVEAISDLTGNRWQFERQNGRLLRLNEWDASGGQGRVLRAHWQGERLTELSLVEEHGEPVTFTRYHYDRDRRLSAEEDATGLCRRYAYSDGRMVSHTLRTGLTFHYAYDEQGRVQHSWGDEGLYNYHFTYRDLLNEVEVTDSLGNGTLIQFDADRLPICEIDAEGNATRYSYDEVGRLVSRTDAARRETRFEWDETGNLITLIKPDRHKISNRYSNNRLITEINEEGAQKNYTWSEQGKLLSYTDELGNRTLYRYDDYGDLIYSMDPKGAETCLDYDRYGFLSRLTDAEGAQTCFQHDSRGLLRQRMDALGQIARWEYDAKGRLTKWRAEDGSVQTLNWDANDNPNRYVDELNGETRLSYSGMGVLTHCTMPDGLTLRREYDTEEQLIAVVNEVGQRYRLERDGLGRIVRTTDYWEQQTAYRYDEAGDLTSRIDALGQKTEYRYDRSGRLTEKRYQDGKAERQERFSYDRCGRLTKVLNPWREITRKYDAAGRLTAEHQDGLGIYYQYDETGNRLSRHTDSGHRVDYGYNNCDQLTSVTLNQQDTSHFTYDAAGRLQDEALSEALNRHSSYDARGNLSSVTVGCNDFGQFSTAYSYDRGGRLTARSDSRQGTDYFSYDPVGRLLSHTCPEGKITRFIQDAAGNQLQTRQHEDQRGWWREGELHGKRYVFDRAGNLRQSVDAEGEKRVYRWDGNQRLRGTHDKNYTVEYGYDAIGRRVFKRSQHETTWFWWDGDALLGEVTRPDGAKGLPDTGALGAEDVAGRKQRQQAAKSLWRSVREYVYWPGSFRPFALLHKAEDDRSCSYYYHNDPNGCPVRLTSGSGKIVWEAQYLAWGGIKRQTRQTDNPLRYQGQYYDRETGLHYNRHRYYNPECGSFISQDPIGLAGGINLYAYAPNALSYIDPFGLAKCPTVERGSNGEITSAQATVTPKDIGTGTAVNATARAFAQSMGYGSSDDAGHILARILGGQGGIGNVFPQLPGVNRGAYRIFEKRVRDYIAKYGTVDIHWTFVYGNGGLRPTQINYDVFMNGNKVLSDVFNN
ncbi:RHS repeat-associated core domain-containing protein [Kalamiella sp. sgz302252]|uniref:RHS repeat-associated core domain-containing protein n=1 Tax=Pantoea sp. sgz302252 TaxID=3341827 RepID=UPI0036D22509